MALNFLLRQTLVAFRISLLAVAMMISVAALRAEVRFDVFIGYDGTVREANWFPITCEIMNNGPGFVGVIEVTPSSYGKGQTQRFPIELPTGTLKRITIPTFAATRYQMGWDVQLLDERGRVRAESMNTRSQRSLGWETKLMGALPRTPSGMVSLRSIKRNQPDLQPAAARFQPVLFPDNPLMLEAMDAIYVNSEVAVSLRADQVNALLAWMNAGGHLIVAIEQISDVTGVPWLRNVLPCEPQDIVSVGKHGELDRWLKQEATTQGSYAFGDQSYDSVFEAAEIRVVTGKLRDGKPLVSVDDKPLIIAANRGLGRITTLMFSPEREPFKSWRELPALWTVLLDVPLKLYVSTDYNSGYGNAVDGIFGAMIDSRQIHKLPVGWLLLLLLVYLLVIGPVDRIWLKKINRPMLTWITFPCYVLLFSGLIYFIGYKLRAGDSEYNELHIVDVLERGERAEWRGRTYASIYSPANARYPMVSELKFATLRGEYMGSRAGDNNDKAEIVHTGDNFKAEAMVPVWTSQLFVSDWWHSGEIPVTATVRQNGGDWEVIVENRSGKVIPTARLAFGGLIYELGEIPASAPKTVSLQKVSSTTIEQFVNSHASHYASTARERQYAFGSRSGGRIDDLPTAGMVTSLLGQYSSHEGMNIVTPSGQDVSKAVGTDRAVLLAWLPDVAPVPALNQIKTKRRAVNTLWRVPISVSTQN